jgi:hypothetical protein
MLRPNRGNGGRLFAAPPEEADYGPVARKRWDELSPRTRRTIVVVGAFEGALKISALVDLARRPAAEIRGSKLRWAIAITAINSAGAVPIGYFVYGRLRPSAT